MIKTKFKKLVIAKLFGITKIYNSFYIKKVKKNGECLALAHCCMYYINTCHRTDFEADLLSETQTFIGFKHCIFWIWERYMKPCTVLWYFYLPVVITFDANMRSYCTVPVYLFLFPHPAHGKRILSSYVKSSNIKCIFLPELLPFWCMKSPSCFTQTYTQIPMCDTIIYSGFDFGQ